MTLSTAGLKYRVPGPASINQTDNKLSKFKPMFANFEIKVDDRDPLVQLGVWAAAEFSKRQLEAYPMNVPIPSITIDGDIWQLYIAYATEDPKKTGVPRGKAFRAKFIGPVDIGDTKSIKGIFKILHITKAIVRWGIEVYKPEYFEKVMKIYRQK